MSSIVYAIVFNGDLVEGFQGVTVKAQLAKALKADATKMAALFSGKPIVLKRTADKAEALKYGTALKRLGADVKIKVLQTEATAAKPAAVPTPRPATAAARATAAPKPVAPSVAPSVAPVRAAAKAPVRPTATAPTHLSLAPNEGFIVPPKPPTPPPNLDLSRMSVKANDGTPLVAPTPFKAVEVDTSAISLKANDGTPLVDPVKKDVPVVEVPDFGLDAPGAVLDTIKEDKVLLNPDTSGMSIAPPGVDLLDEPVVRPPPKVPDISRIHLVPNFDR
jgi:hypothetical protein